MYSIVSDQDLYLLEVLTFLSIYNVLLYLM